PGLRPNPGKHQAREPLRARDLRDQLQLGEKLSLHSGKEGPSDVEADPTGDGCDEDHGRPRLRVLCYSFCFPAGKTQNPAWVRLLRRWLCAPATASQPGDPAGAEKVFVIGVRCGNKESQEETTDERNPSLAQVLG